MPRSSHPGAPLNGVRGRKLCREDGEEWEKGIRRHALSAPAGRSLSRSELTLNRAKPTTAGKPRGRAGQQQCRRAVHG